ncbi:hypothetical protein [Methanosarcina horonobensis]|uniref:hypothetical protein n=1 Tax=Methanosarcina horonobensis TaxID=418008 RepID=UPI000A7FCCA0|nr:hypothetical protein [Methanosarcina horonobensis]
MCQADQKNEYRESCTITLGQRRCRAGFFIKKKNAQILARISGELNLSPEDTLGVLLYKELENVSKNARESEKEKGNKEENLRRVFFE